MEHTKRTRIVKQILASLSKCFFAMRIAFIFKFYSKFLQHQSYVFSLWDGGRLRSCHGEPIGRCHDTHPRPRATRKPRHCADEALSAHRGFQGRAPQRSLLRDTEAPPRMLMAPRAERVSSPLAHFEQASARSAQNFFSRKDSWRLKEAEQR